MATLPFDPTYKLMATFHQVDVEGRPVVRCFVKGAAPAVMERATTALGGDLDRRGMGILPAGRRQTSSGWPGPDSG